MTHVSPELSQPPRSWLTRLIASLPKRLEATLGGSQRSALVLMALALVLAIPLIVTPLPLGQQFALAVFLIALGWLLVRLEQRYQDHQFSEQLHLLLVWLSLVVTARYLYYRTVYTLNFDGWLNTTFSLLLYGAELYAIATLLLAYFQTLKLRQRQPVSMATVPQDQWPRVDIYIPTYNEDVEIVRKTALAALAIDYPVDKKAVYILDDGRQYPERRAKLGQICQDLGCHLVTRANNDHAKAGNINHALGRTPGDLVLILDCDHIPTRNLLLETVGFFLNPKVSLVQTPHWFYNPDPFERNLLTQGKIPVGNELFYKVLQKGNDFWNASFFCGSAAVVRKSHLLEVGGIAVETVTEDCHTSLRLHSKGYETVYYDKIMVAGLAPETFSSYVGQQVRWARGMAQILRLEWPLFNRQLSIPQRICYTSATTHFFFGFPRLMYAIAPIAFLMFGINSVRGLGLETLTYALPSILLALNANFIVYKGVRFSFWNEIFEYAMAFQDGLVTFMALVNPKMGRFNVTDKGLQVSKRSFDWHSVQVLLIIGGLSLISLVLVPYWIITELQDVDAVIINATWCVINIMLLSAAILVALEQPQMRESHRLDRQLAVTLFSGQTTLSGKTIDISETGAQLRLPDWPNLPDVVDLEICGDSNRRVFLSGKVLRVVPRSEQEVVVTVAFDHLDQTQQDALVLVLYSDVNQWYSQVRHNADKPLESIRFLLTSLIRVFYDPKPSLSPPVFKQVQAPSQLYSQGHYLGSTTQAVNSQGLKMALEQDPRLVLHPEIFGVGEPVGLLINSQGKQPVRLVAQLDRVHRSETAVTLDLSFPKVLNAQQGHRIKALLCDLPAAN
ncbi:UDP-forming cellulose synthase catalytic subunit [Nodosilinea sp. P-1105]|uniref:UDP-forming cellulose synthase catalytic subunit n=1 Tax=Nodosilinea sp. P-1105 TaxID=2546229 RepID=UPI00146CAFAB|nr:UDP-forming cellulose synthase catalytic subunit [Nodosilinea sp. P-1105]NMF84914.1 UDP-forming cellulose synthase catalytic subunit [Nodosilinea sp. P-1105]